MSVLILNGSPRKNGNTAFFIDKIRKETDCDVFDVYHTDFFPCTDCRQCIDGKCIFDDAVTDLLRNIDRYSTVIIASPLYFNQPSGMLMAMMSRTQLFYNSNKKLKEKDGYVILTGGGDTIINSSDAEKTIRIMLKGLNVKVKDYVRSLRTSEIPAWEDHVAIKKTEEIINKLKNKA